MFLGFSPLLRRVWASVPTQCLFCQAWPVDAAVCAACVQQHLRPAVRCALCACRLPPELGDSMSAAAVCGACAHTPPPLWACTAALDYEPPWAGLIGRWKFHEQAALASFLAARLLAHSSVRDLLSQVDAIIPIPPSSARLRQRGYHHTLMLARALCAQVECPPPIWPQALLRLPGKDELSQAKRKRSERLAQMKNAFLPAPATAPLLRGARILLLDDVMTTGATLYSAAQVLQQAGAEQVCAAVVARTPLLKTEAKTAKKDECKH